MAKIPNGSVRASGRPLRLWPGVAAGVLVALLWFVVPPVFPDLGLAALFAALGCSTAVVIWWLFFSRAPWSERIGIVLLAVVAVIAVRPLVDPSIAGGMMRMMLPVYSIPILSIAIAAGAVLAAGMSQGVRRVTMAVFVVLAAGSFTLIRTGGILGIRSELHWRWTPTPEQRLLALSANEKDPSPPPAPMATPIPAVASPTSAPVVVASPPAPSKPAEWPGFRGPARDSIVRGVRLDTDWEKTPPVQIWRRPIGPGWSSFAVNGAFIYTQEQRGDDEIVSCYSLATGEPVWRHRDKARFWESNGGPGPRGTPTVVDGRVYTFGATGILNALDARDGAIVWSRNAAADTRTKLPGWGFASSPLVLDDEVVVATAGVLAAYDVASGHPRWQGPPGRGGYSSPQLATIDGVPQILLLNGEGAMSVSPKDGALLWKHAWQIDGIVQPSVLEGTDVLIGSGSGLADGVGMRRVSIEHPLAGAHHGEWNVVERWTSRGLKPYFNDFVVHNGYAFGFDGAILSCIDLADGQKKWKGGRYGQGQMIVLPEQDLLLVLSEEGDLALVKATPDQFTEMATFKAIEGKTWNHPVLIGDTLLVRNGEEMAAFRLPLAAR